MLSEETKVGDALFRVVDTETTGLDPETDALVEVGAVDVFWNERVGGWCLEEIGSTLVNPGRSIPPAASAVHHLTDADVARAPDPVTALRAYLEPVAEAADAVLVAHNAAFDAPMVGLDPETWLCTRRWAADVWPDAPSHSNQVLRYWLGLKVAEAQGLAAHRALADAWVTAYLLRRLLEASAVPHTLTVAELLRGVWAPTVERTCRFGKHKGTPWAEVPTGYLEWMVGKGDEAWSDKPDALYTAKVELRRRNG